MKIEFSYEELLFINEAITLLYSEFGIDKEKDYECARKIAELVVKLSKEKNRNLPVTIF